MIVLSAYFSFMGLIVGNTVAKTAFQLKQLSPFVGALTVVVDGR